MRLLIVCLAGLVFVGHGYAEQEQRSKESVIQYFPRSQSGEKVEDDMDSEAEQTFNRIVVDQIKKFCSNPRNRVAGKCGNIEAVIRQNPAMVVPPRGRPSIN